MMRRKYLILALLGVLPVAVLGAIAANGVFHIRTQDTGMHG